MAKRKRLNRTTDMDDALFDALKSAVPRKDTGPDPDDILARLFDEGEGEEPDVSGLNAAGDVSMLEFGLDEVDRQHAGQIVKIIREQTGEEIDLAKAIRTALCACQLDENDLLWAYKTVCQRPLKNE